MDQQIEELKELVRQNISLSGETNKMLHAMRRGARWRTFFSIVWWLAIFAVSGAAYYYYLQPYLERLIQLYQQFQQGGQHAQSAGQQLSSFFGNILPKQ
ncbi:MAG: hypothetical protein KGH79_02180 [Patescibacteria group bacterium]|nr:hypothetical protein [Patescibacteria group bacterium]